MELAITMAGLALVSAAMVAFLVGTTRVDQAQAADDAAQEAVRDARGRLAKDIREARRFTAVSPTSFTVWVDDEWDGVMASAELITWSIDSTGALMRAVGEAGGRVEARGVSQSDSRITYDHAVAAQVTRTYLHLVVGVTGPQVASRTVDFEVSLRNVP